MTIYSQYIRDNDLFDQIKSVPKVGFYLGEQQNKSSADQMQQQVNGTKSMTKGQEDIFNSKEYKKLALSQKKDLIVIKKKEITTKSHFEPFIMQMYEKLAPQENIKSLVQDYKAFMTYVDEGAQQEISVKRLNNSRSPNKSPRKRPQRQLPKQYQSNVSKSTPVIKKVDPIQIEIDDSDSTSHIRQIAQKPKQLVDLRREDLEKPLKYEVKMEKPILTKAVQDSQLNDLISDIKFDDEPPRATTPPLKPTKPLERQKTFEPVQRSDQFEPVTRPRSYSVTAEELLKTLSSLRTEGLDVQQPKIRPVAVRLENSKRNTLSTKVEVGDAEEPQAVEKFVMQSSSEQEPDPVKSVIRTVVPDLRYDDKEAQTDFIEEERKIDDIKSNKETVEAQLSAKSSPNTSIKENQEIKEPEWFEVGVNQAANALSKIVKVEPVVAPVEKLDSPNISQNSQMKKSLLSGMKTSVFESLLKKQADSLSPLKKKDCVKEEILKKLHCNKPIPPKRAGLIKTNGYINHFLSHKKELIENDKKRRQIHEGKLEDTDLYVQELKNIAERERQQAEEKYQTRLDEGQAVQQSYQDFLLKKWCQIE